MSKVLKVSLDEDIVTMLVERENGDKERWFYAREEHDGLISYILIEMEDTK